MRRMLLDKVVPHPGVTSGDTGDRCCHPPRMGWKHPAAEEKAAGCARFLRVSVERQLWNCDFLSPVHQDSGCWDTTVTRAHGLPLDLSLSVVLLSLPSHQSVHR